MKDEEFAVIFNEHKNAVFQFSWRVSGSSTTAEDVTQDVFLALLRRDIEVDDSRGSPRALLLGTARHLIWKKWRQDQRWRSLTNEEYIAQPLPFESDGRQEAVALAVSSLPPLQREALVLATYDELSLREIAEVLQVEVGTLKARLHRARENLKRMLASYCSAGIGSLEGYGTNE